MKRMAITPRIEATAKSKAVRSHFELELVPGLATDSVAPGFVFSAPFTPWLADGFCVEGFGFV